MPELSRFLGIVIAMYYREHGPPHFHAVYADFEIALKSKAAESAEAFRAAPCPMFRNGE